MKIELAKKTIDMLTRVLNVHEDAQKTAEGEYTVDLYEREPPLSMELAINEKGVEALAVAELLFDEEMDGWYLGKRIDSAEQIARALTDWLAMDAEAKKES